MNEPQTIECAECEGSGEMGHTWHDGTQYSTSDPPCPLCFGAGRLTERQLELQARHGTPEKFTEAIFNALGEISIGEAQKAIALYRSEWSAAGALRSLK